jgi:uncharacterized protein YprB with RNaseH-like and TPR domain
MTADSPNPQSLADKLKSLGVKTGAADLPTRGPIPRYEIDSVLTGAYHPTPYGETFLHDETYAADYRHGLAPISLTASLDLLSAWAGDARLRGMPVESFAFVDTETSGLAGGTGTYAFLVGAGKFQNGEFFLRQFFMRDPSEESALLHALAEFLAPCESLVTYNGKAFDAPLLNTRYTLHAIPTPIKELSHVDLLPLARRLWRDRLPSRTLKYIEENVLGAPRSDEEVPGYEIPYLYFDYLRSRDARPLKGVFYHNAMDIVALAALFSHTALMLDAPFSEIVQHGLDVVALAKLHEDLHRWDTAARLYEHSLSMNLDEPDFWTAVQRLASLQKRRGDLESALSWWEQAAAEGHIYAHIELAKHYEHRLKDYNMALHHTSQAMQLAEAPSLPGYIRQHWLGELGHRKSRLESRLGIS